MASLDPSPTPATGETAAKAALAVMLAGLGAVLIVVVCVGSKKLSFSILGAIVLLGAFAFMRNQRLFCLWGLVLTAPLAASKAFFIMSHMGGASAVTFDADDVFLIPLLLFIARDLIAKRLERPRFSPVLIWWGGLWGLGLINVVLGPMRHLAALELVRMAKCYLLFFVIINEVLRVRQFVHFAAALVSGVALQGLVAITQFTVRRSLGLQFLGEPPLESVATATKSVYLGAGDIYRAGGLFSHANLLGGYMAMLLPLCVALFFTRLSTTRKALLAGVVVLGVCALLITLSRSGWMSFGVGFTALMIGVVSHPRMRRTYRATISSVLIVTVLGLGLAAAPMIKRVTRSDPGAINFRLDMMQVAWGMIVERPILGVGLNGFVPLMPAYSKFHGPRGVSNEYGPIWPVVHNSYLITWSEQGTVGFLFLMGLYASVLRLGLQTYRRCADGLLSALNLGACCGVLAIMVDGLGSFFIDETASERVFWLIVGLIVAINAWTRANAATAPGGAPAAVGPVSAAPAAGRP